MMEALSDFLELFEDDPDALCVGCESYEQSLGVLKESLDQLEILIDGSTENRAEDSMLLIEKRQNGRESAHD